MQKNEHKGQVRINGAWVAAVRLIEPEEGATYRRSTWAVYDHFTFPSGCMAGKEGRAFVAGGFATVASAQAAYPEAECHYGEVVDMDRNDNGSSDDDEPSYPDGQPCSDWSFSSNHPGA